MKESFTTFIFDLDGTLLDTLPDLVILTNKVLESKGLPLRSEQEILSFVGNGFRALMYQAVPQGTDPQKAEEAVESWREMYPTFGSNLTKPYSEIEHVVNKLYEQNKTLGVLSNKFDAGAKQIVTEYFPGVFSAIYGEGPGIPRKPDPTGLLKIMEELGAKPEETLYVGDSFGDFLTAQRAGIQGLCVSWGYHSKHELEKAGVAKIIESPLELLEFV